ncbi:nuclear transport factor 2 family protein [Bradyrhizobium barranii]
MSRSRPDLRLARRAAAARSLTGGASAPVRPTHPSSALQSTGRQAAKSRRQSYAPRQTRCAAASIGPKSRTLTNRTGYTGHDQVGGFFQRTMELSGGAFSMDVHNVLAEDDLVVALVTVNAERNGLSASFPEIHVWQMKNGKATDFREYQGDEQREDQFWS